MANEADLRRVQAADLYTLGFTQVEISERLGVSQPRVSQMLEEARALWRNKSMNSSYEDLVIREHEHLMVLRKSLLDGIVDGDFKSIDAATRLAERVARLLGLDHSDRMAERTVRVEEAKVQMLGAAVAALLDHLDIHGDARVEALQVMDRAVTTRELV